MGFKPVLRRVRRHAQWLLCAALLGFAGCARTYVVTLSGGRTFTARGKPRYDKVTATYVCTDASGRKVVIPAIGVREIAPASMSRQPVITPTVVKPGR